MPYQLKNPTRLDKIGPVAYSYSKDDRKDDGKDIELGRRQNFPGQELGILISTSPPPD
ncbi:hypothetical protein K3495_g7877 [Podosphaera aphanis]|nr:hypothetical protein K3495_g7877 [Podosphaera aphanis]